MCFGFECGDGWYDLIDSLCRQLQKTTDKYGDPQIVAFQVKEKFGTLRFYINGGTDNQYKIIDEFEKISSKTCEECGSEKNVSLYNEGWLYTRCLVCIKKLKKNKDGTT